MKRVALVTDAQTPLGEELIRRYLAHGYCVAATRSNQARIETPLVSEEEAFLLIDWNRKSPISTRNVLLTTLNRFSRIDHTLLLLAPELEKKLLQEISTETIDRAVDTWIKGSLFMAKAVLEHYGEKKEGRLALINHIRQEAGTMLPPLESALRGSFSAAAGVLLASNSQPNVILTGIESKSGTVQEFADFIFAAMSERAARVSGKWLRFPARRRLFAGLRGPAPGADATLRKGADATLRKGADATLRKGADATLRKGADATLRKGADATLRKGEDATLRDRQAALPPDPPQQ